MTIRFTKYLKDAAVFKPMDERITIEVTPEDLNLIISVRALRKQPNRGTTGNVQPITRVKLLTL